MANSSGQRSRLGSSHMPGRPSPADPPPDIPRSGATPCHYGAQSLLESPVSPESPRYEEVARMTTLIHSCAEFRLCADCGAALIIGLPVPGYTAGDSPAVSSAVKAA